MSSHRASKASPPRASTSSILGRRRAGAVSRRRLPGSALVGVGALLVVAAGGATAGHVFALSSGSTSNTGASVTQSRTSADRSTPAASRAAAANRTLTTDRRSDGPSLTAPAARQLDNVSRSSARPALSSGPKLTKATEQQVTARSARLSSVALNALSYAKVLASDTWTLPTTGFHISTWFGESGPYWSSGYHTGIDFATAYGTPVVAVADATVAQTGWDGPYGNQIRLQFKNGDQVWYNHLSAIEVQVGQQVRRGQTLGRVGETGNAYGAHLHFEYRLAKDLHTAVDPLPFLDAHGIHLR